MRVPSKAERIRRLHALGWSTAEIAKHVGVRYQHAYNVISQDTMRKIYKAHQEAAAARAEEVHG